MRFFILLLYLFQGAYAQDYARLSQNRIQTVELINRTFLGDWQRNYYGDDAPERLDILWKHYLGKGITVISTKLGEREWAGSGWTGQPLLVKEDSILYIIQGAFDHHLKKIRARDGQLIWQYKFDDVIKGTGTLWENSNAQSLEESILVLQGSRRGLTNDLDSKYVPSFRAISYFSGKEIWRLDVKRTHSYSRDVDGSGVVLNDMLYIGLENALFTVVNPDPIKAGMKDEMLQPEIIQETKLYTQKDAIAHGGNLVVESSPCLLNNHLYITAGSGHVYGYNVMERRLNWDFFIGSDMDGSPVVTADRCLLIPVEKQYIRGAGGVYKLNPAESPASCVEWFFPTQDTLYETWEGGVIGSVCVNDRTKEADAPFLAAFIALDGNLYVVNHTEIDTLRGNVLGTDSTTFYPCPKLVFQADVGPSIATPLIIGNKIIAATYEGIFLFQFDTDLSFVLLDKWLYRCFESTPVVHNGRIYVGSRDGYLYCFGKKM